MSPEQEKNRQEHWNKVSLLGSVVGFHGWLNAIQARITTSKQVNGADVYFFNEAANKLHNQLKIIEEQLRKKGKE